MAGEGARKDIRVDMFARAVLIGFLIGFAAILFLGNGQESTPMAVASAVPGSAEEQPGTLQNLPILVPARLPRPIRA